MNNYFYSGEVILDYDNIDKAIRDLRSYIEYDEIYNQYINKTKEKFDDTEIYCINHILALEKLLEEYKKIKKEMEKINNENIKNKNI